jgi:hypothetical protein
LLVTVSIGRTTFACLLATAALVLTALLAMPAGAGAATIYACKKPNGVIRLVGRRTRCRRGQTKLSWNTEGPAGRNGANGANGSNGANGGTGPAGARGPAGAFNVVDASGRVIGPFAGFGPFSGPNVYLDSGVVLSYDNVPSTNYPNTLYTALVYKDPNCVGTPYVSFFGYFFEWPILLPSPPVPGTQIYSAIPGPPESFTYQSVRSSTGCRNSSAAVTFGFQVRENGIVPIVQEPLRLVPVR